ncbi:response regulator [Oceanisphaera sp. W20_SRM_FM3]|uniref:response regulator n=1 Tax=Oceanisphaera sp. W20_SRM_FM3 TaxID=3240267 RepID=UPI003F977EBF
MTTHILICDDSLVARKQVASALPIDWPVELHFAENGNQALTFLQNHGADVLFLDLNMPELDGYGVLSIIKEQSLSVITVVISGDIQPEAEHKVRTLGAIGFITKPINQQELARLLIEYGLYRSDAAPAATPNELEPNDAVTLFEYLQEMANIAMGQASNLLAQLLKVFIHQPIPKVALIARSELNMAISAIEGNTDYAAVCQGFVGAGVSGEALLLFTDTNSEQMAKLLHYENETSSAPEIEALLDISNILFSAFIKGLGEQLDIHFGLGQPHILGRHQPIEGLLAHHRQQTEQLLCIEIPYELEQQNINCNLLVLLTESSVTRLEQRLSYLLQ